MARTKGAKNKPKKRKPIVYGSRGNLLKGERGIILSNDELIRIDQARKAAGNRIVKLDPKEKEASEYLMAVFEIFKAQIEPGIPDRFPDDAHNNFKYMPLDIWRGISCYIDVSLKSGQPITMSGMAVFAGINTKTLLTLRNSPILHPAYHFIKKVSDFVEMFNEFAAHKKQNPAGAIFILKNMGWKDKFEIEASQKKGALTEAEREIAQERIKNSSEKV